MRTISSISPGDLLITGRLTFNRTGPTRRPTLGLDYLDPFIHQPRLIDLPDDFVADAVIEIPVNASTFDATASAWLVADPRCLPETRSTLRYFAERLKAWQAEQRAADRLAPRPRIAVLATEGDRPWL
jgi:hypothetical protein